MTVTHFGQFVWNPVHGSRLVRVFELIHAVQHNNHATAAAA